MTGVIPSLGSMPSLGKLATHGRPDYWTTLGRIQSNMVLDFTSATISDTLAARGFTFTRSGATATRVNSSGVLETVAANTLRIDHDPTTLACLGGLFEEASTNAIRNSTMVGAAAGSPGTLPTNWSSPVYGPAGISFEVVGTGTESGIAYIDIRAYGTPSATDFVRISMETNTGVAAATGQTWCVSAYVALVGGSFANTTGAGLGLLERTSGGAYVADGNASITVTSGALAGKRYAYARTLAGGATTGAVVPQVLIRGVTSGNPIDVTLRIGAPQLEQKAFATSYIPTSTAAVTRNADALTLGDLSRIGFNPAASSVIAQGRILGQSALVYPGVVALGMGVEGDKVVLYRDGNSSRFAVEAKVAGVAQYSLSVTAAPATGAEYKTAFAFAADDAAQTTSGAAPVKDASVALSTILDRMSIGGFQARGGGTNGAQIIRRVDYYPRRLPDADLQSLTA